MLVLLTRVRASVGGDSRCFIIHFFFFSSRRRHTRFDCDWSSDVCSSDLRVDEPWSAALTIPHDKVRVSFAVPWQDMLLLGTTDTLFEGGPEAVQATEAEVDRKSVV